MDRWGKVVATPGDKVERRRAKSAWEQVRNKASAEKSKKGSSPSQWKVVAKLDPRRFASQRLPGTQLM